VGNVSIVSDEERFGLIRKHLETVAEILATFEAAYEDGIALVQSRALEMIREASLETRLAHADASAGTDEVDALEI
jgi:hypothetical protein